MNVAAKRRKSKQRLFDGRIEKRFTMSVPVYLTGFSEPRFREGTTAEKESTVEQWRPLNDRQQRLCFGQSFGRLPLSAPRSSSKAIPQRTGFNQFCLLAESLSGSGSGNPDHKIVFAAD